ncbi:MAG: DNA-3-methyladenine glycosylase [Acidimicrobiia bacterium]|nr:DNA-3-methyladenine glycosylase [Acidimicrobiia bacterium]
MSLREALSGTALEAAPRLLGRRVTTRIGGVETAVVLTEVEAYEGAEDPASHAYRGETPRVRSMFGPAGTLYVYRSYGIHWCMNVTVGPAGVGRAVLLRGGRIAAGEEAIRRRRGREDHLTDGPGKLCQALGVTGELDGSDVFDGPVVVSERVEATGHVERTPRIGISKAVDRPWRFLLRD